MEQGSFITGAAYIRVSTEDQLEFSPDSQMKKIREYASRHRIRLPEGHIYIDEGISGRYARNRPAFMRMIRNAKQKPRPFEQILVWKFSRFARNRQDSILYKSMLRKEYGISVVSITEQLSDDPTSILIEALLEAMDEYYSINLAQEVRRGMNEKFSRGGVVCAPPFGYRMGEGRYVPDTENAQCVKMIFADFLQGMTFREIADKLNEKGICTSRGNKFEPRTVKYILGNPTYTGQQRRHMQGVGAESAEVVVSAYHEPLITENDFQGAQRRIQMLERMHMKYSRTSQTDFMLRGLVRCSVCGSTLIQVKRGKTLQCGGYARGQCSVSHSISMSKINALVLEKLEYDMKNMEDDMKKQDRADVPVLLELLSMLKQSSFTENEKNKMLRSIVEKIIFTRRDESVRIFYHPA